MAGSSPPASARTRGKALTDYAEENARALESNPEITLIVDQEANRWIWHPPEQPPLSLETPEKYLRLCGGGPLGLRGVGLQRQMSTLTQQRLLPVGVRRPGTAETL